MRRFVFLTSSIIVATISAQAAKVGVAPGRILLREKPGVTRNQLDATLQGVNGTVEGTIPGINVKVLKVPEAAREKVMAALQRNPHIEFAEPDYLHAPDYISNDPYLGSQWHLSKIQAPTAWDLSSGSENVIIAVIDTGVDGRHPDLQGKLLSGWNFYDGNSNWSDVHGHGTWVAGSAAAAVNNGQGVASVAPNCPILPIRVSDANGWAYDSKIAEAINWAADRGAKVANVSFAISTSSTVRSAAQNFQSRGGLVIAAAGNEGTFQSATDNPYIVTVSATDQNDALASWSNHGNNVDLSAPGSSILTTGLGGSYVHATGTSFSSPIVAGAAALVFSAQPSFSPAAVVDVLKRSATDLGYGGWDTQFGSGRLNVLGALQLALNQSAPAPTPTPSPTPTADTTAPSVVITSPATGSRIGNTVTVYVNATDNVSVAKVELYVDGYLTSLSTAAPFTTKWTSRKARSGAHNLQTKAYDAAGNSSVSQVITVYK
jgi:subtilisin family serine protease